MSDNQKKGALTVSMFAPLIVAVAGVIGVLPGRAA